MPSGRTHDAITFMLAGPVFGLAYLATTSLAVSITMVAAFVFGGFMFGPDLDTISCQYTRWGIFRALWFPYRSVFKHRSRWSHGLIFGTLFRVVYCLGVISLLAISLFFARAMIVGAAVPALSTFNGAWSEAGAVVRHIFGANILPAVFIGMWAGAASHTFADMASTYVRTGRITEFL